VLESEGRQRPSEIENVWNHDGRPIFKFAGIDSITDAEVWAGADILVSDSERAQPKAGEYSHADLIGCRVLADRPIGVVKSVEEYGGPPLLKIEAMDGREILVPFAHSICREIDVAAKVIRVDLPEGLLDL
jgi:16S rRNA processing protein RimM